MLGTACPSTSRTVDKLILYTMSMALATSPGTSTLHRFCSSLLHSAFTIPHLFQPGTCEASNTALSHWNTKLRVCRKQQHPPNLLPPARAAASSVSVHHCSQCHHPAWQVTEHTPPQPWPACPPPHNPEPRNTNSDRVFWETAYWKLPRDVNPTL